MALGKSKVHETNKDQENKVEVEIRKTTERLNFE